MNNFKANPDYINQEMMKDIGIKSVDELFSMIPKAAKTGILNLPDAMSEMETQKTIKAIAAENNIDKACFIGGGAYKRFIPACVSQISSRFEFNTAYTPYQPEISQGTLQVIYEFQSMICDLTGMDVSNASVYDGAEACAEAILMAARISGRNKFLVSDGLNPEYKEAIKTYAWASDLEIEFAPCKDYASDFNFIQEKVKNNDYGAVMIQVPNYYGTLEDINKIENLEKDSKTLTVICADTMSLAVLKKPSEYGADIVTGDVQSFGNPMSFGGPFAGFIAAKDKYKRQLPGRIVGRTLDADGNQAFTLTLQAREQHIRREKATSNICSNQALTVLNAVVYLTVMGKTGLKQAAYLSSKNAHMLAKELSNKGFDVLNKEFFNEFILKVKNSDEFLNNLKAHNILAGIKIDSDKILVCTTELNTKEEIELYTEYA